MDSLFQFRLEEHVILNFASGCFGIVVARLEATDHPPRYLVRHMNKAGDPAETWFWASEITHDCSAD
ncbi:hypothetical protein [uncultured Martelella sp.]|uniref:hypothetical protein n=1 Tax=uncultured Martelella sp. TaxID=392331 RepID=UPI0029C6AD84|nr:hypothetical protein [uncultured Martelella sp.]